MDPIFVKRIEEAQRRGISPPILGIMDELRFRPLTRAALAVATFEGSAGPHWGGEPHCEHYLKAIDQAVQQKLIEEFGSMEYMRACKQRKREKLPSCDIIVPRPGELDFTVHGYEIYRQIRQAAHPAALHGVRMNMKALLVDVFGQTLDSCESRADYVAARSTYGRPIAGDRFHYEDAQLVNRTPPKRIDAWRYNRFETVPTGYQITLSYGYPPRRRKKVAKESPSMRDPDAPAHTVNFDRTHADDVVLRTLPHPTEVEYLWLRDTRVTSAGLIYLERMTNLRMLAISGTAAIGDENLDVLARLPNLEYLNLVDTAVGDAGVKSLSASSSLRRLLLSGTRITDAAAPSLAALSGLTSLYVGHTAIGDASLPYIGRLTQLDDLELTRTRITDAGMIHLRDLANLTKAFFDQTAIGDHGLLHIGRMKKLRVLFLGHTQVTDLGLVHLRELPELGALWLNNTAVTGAGVRQLASLPLDRLGVPPTAIGDELPAGLRALATDTQRYLEEVRRANES